MNGSQPTDNEEFYSTVELKLTDLTDSVSEWQHYYNWQRTHGSLKGLTPMEKVCQLMDKTPLQEEVSDAYVVDNERIQNANYRIDLELRKLKPCL